MRFLDGLPPIPAPAVLGVIALLLIVIWSIRRHLDPTLRIESNSPIDELVTSLAGLTLSTAVAGNSVEILENGAFFDVLLARIRSAEKSVHFETFLWKDGVLGRRVADALSQRARAGIQVRVLLDATGSRRLGKFARRQMHDAGCKLAWLGDAQDREHFADVSVRLHGPIVNSVQAAFSENWAGDTGELFVGSDVFPTLAPAGDVVIHAAYAKPEGSAPAVKILHHTAITLARKRIWIQNPYFIPEPDAIDAFGEAVKRGVDVRVLMPSTSGSDNPIVQHAGHRNFEKLLRCGVRLFEYPHTLLHQKVMTVDGVWSAIGSSNFDDRSFETNDEITLGIKDIATAKRLDAIFEKYMPQAEEIELKAWRRRGIWHKLMDNAFYLMNEIL